MRLETIPNGLCPPGICTCVQTVKKASNLTIYSLPILDKLINHGENSFIIRYLSGLKSLHAAEMCMALKACVDLTAYLTLRTFLTLSMGVIPLI